MDYLTLADTATGPEWLPYAVAGVLAVVSLILLLGKGSWLIAGYNTASKEKKAMFDKKKLCQVVGCGLLAITVMILITAIFGHVLPAQFAGVFLVIVVIIIGIVEVLIHSICKLENNDSTEEQV